MIDSTTQSITVPDFAKTQVSFGTPRVFRARTAREMLLVRNNLDATPTATREFSRGERLLIRFDAYAAGGARPEVTAKLLNRTGASMADVPVQAAEGKPFQIDFPLASLAPGEYLIQIDAKSRVGHRQAGPRVQSRRRSQLPTPAKLQVATDASSNFQSFQVRAFVTSWPLTLSVGSCVAATQCAMLPTWTCPEWTYLS